MAGYGVPLTSDPLHSGVAEWAEQGLKHVRALTERIGEGGSGVGMGMGLWAEGTREG